MTVLAPADAIELVAMMEWANAYDGPVYLRLVRDAVPDVLPDGYTFTPGAVHELRSGRDVALVSTGPQTGRTLTAAAQLAEQGIEASVVHVPSLKPVDGNRLVGLLGSHSLVVTVEEHSVYGGLGGLVAETLTGAGPSPKIVRVGIDDTWGESAGNDFMLTKHGLSPEAVASTVTHALRTPQLV